MREDYLPCCRPHEVANAARLHIKAASLRSIDLGDDYDSISIEYPQMA